MEEVYIHQLFAASAKQYATLDAIVHQHQAISYEELDKQSSTLADKIRTIAPTAPFVGISTTRGIPMIIGILAILKAGKAYIPLDKDYPETRLNQIIGDALLAYCLAPAEEASFFQQLSLSVIDGSATKQPLPMAPTQEAKLSAHAYVLYTSGSTGLPKGVLMGHQPLVNLLQWQNKHTVAISGTRTLQFSPLTFDVSFQEIFATLTTGGTLVLIEDDIRLNSVELLQFIEAKNINRIFLPFVALQMLADTAGYHQLYPSDLQEVITAGEQLKVTTQLVNFFAKLPKATLSNQYGPTECHVVSALTLAGPASAWPELPSIGAPIDHVQLWVLNDDFQEVEQGTIGELYIGGKCLAEGYLHKEELTKEKFIQWTHQGKEQRIYRTGDLARQLPDGTFEFLGRKDLQVKVRGYRIELGEIEVQLNRLPQVKDAVVQAFGQDTSDKKLVAFLVPSSDNRNLEEIKTHLKQQMPAYMVPSAFVWVDAFPKTASGKVDRKALSLPILKRPEGNVPYKSPTTALEKQLCLLWATLLQLDRVGIDDNFFDLGGNSLLAQKTVNHLTQQHAYRLPITKLYQFPTIAGIASYLSGKHQAKRRLPIKPSQNLSPIAIIGIELRFPGAATVDEFLTMLRQGKEGISFFKPEELDQTIPEALKQDTDYVAARGILHDIESFDAAFFGISPALAEVMDPQHRIFLELSRDLLEKTGNLSCKKDQDIGVFAGCGSNTYFLNHVLHHPEKISRLGNLPLSYVSEKDYISSRTAYHLDLKGPAVSVLSACSTSALAVAQAVENLREGKCTLAIAGGATIHVPTNSGHLYQEGSMFSKDGHCRPFDADATGTVFSDGVGLILLKPLEQALQDHDTIYAVIKGIGINNDGANKGSFTAPNAEGQSAAIQMAIAEAQVDPSHITYIETHGTATPIGDPIEIDGLSLAFGETGQKQYCAIGSVKSNLGHLTHASGIAGIIKTSLSIYHQQLFPTLHYRKPNPAINFKESPFFVNDTLRSWEDQKRIAGVSSFGVGGTNVHLLLEAAPETAQPETDTTTIRSGEEVICWSAHSATSVLAYGQKLKNYLHHYPDTRLQDLAYTLNRTRQDYTYRLSFAVSSVAALQEQLQQEASLQAFIRPLNQQPESLAFLFPGQGSQFIHMGKTLYEQEAVFKAAVDHCATILLPIIQEDLRQVIYPETPDTAAQEKLKNTYYTQPAIFVISYALAQLWMSWGLKPNAFIGHSVGEFVAAHLSGVFRLEDALRLVAYRAKIIQALPGGSMLSVRLPEQELRELLPEQLSIAAINAPQLCVVSGETDQIQAFSDILQTKQVANRVLQTSHAFHSAMMEPVLNDFEALVKQIDLHVPKIPIVSTVTGLWLSDEEATSPSYWSNHMRATVQFSKAVVFLEDALNPVWLEVGPGNIASTLIQQHGAACTFPAISSLPMPTSANQHTSIQQAIGKLWQVGLPIDWSAYFGDSAYQLLLDLPTYAYDKKRHWLGKDNRPTAFKNDIHPIMTRKEHIIGTIRTLLEDASGIDLSQAKNNDSFLEIGLDSLLLTQIASNLKREFNVPITFRQLNEHLYSLELLGEYLDGQLPPDRFQPQQVQQPQQIQQAQQPQQVVSTVTPVPPLTIPQQPIDFNTTAVNQTALGLIAQQLNLLSQQIQLLQGQGAVSVAPTTKANTANTIANHAAPAAKAETPSTELTAEELINLKKPFGATAKIEKQATALREEQLHFLQDFIHRYNEKTKQSKAYCQQHRSYMADPRIVSGFKPYTKEMTYSLVVNRSSGSYLWDIDGNQYVDALNGFGSNFLGYQAPVLKEALLNQIEKGYEIGPQHELAGEVCKLLCTFTQADRAALCNTGSEAVLGAIRIARTVTGKKFIVSFNGSYHGINDEVLVRGTKKLKSFPAAAGIMPEFVQDILVLDYGTEEALRIIEERADDLAAVLVEPVQSRRPEFQPVDFLKKLRQLTTEKNVLLIFDEVITGFRMHPGGAQALFNIKADIATYGKVIGGGLSIGAITGKTFCMDALDGGFWQYGDASVPEIGVTYFAGTFVRHPLVLATAHASLNYMKSQGPALQEGLNKRTHHLAEALNAYCTQYQVPIYIAHFGSLWKIKFHEEYPYYELLFAWLRFKGIHIWDGFPCFLSAAHSDKDVEKIIQAFGESLAELTAAGFIPTGAVSSAVNGTTASTLPFDKPPVPGAKLGKDESGNPAWFIAHEGNGQYAMVKPK
ncbi:hypothetical protein GCM10023231_03330 [Olivibacter ginsenosidimutans]|uniref:Amino acid adenylation domain-containing protein n=1 Tax=Olivibacter ginsenosidimutans TaxID=1176537 RepID=A0ABP9AEL3_9SPHI